MKVEVAVLGSPSLIVRTVSVNVSNTKDEEEEVECSRGVQEVCESGGGRPGLPVPNSPQMSLWT